MTANAALPTISHRSLLAKSAPEVQSLREAGESYGFFYLRLDAAGDEEILRRYSQVRDFMKLYFAKSTAEKMRDCKSSDTIEYEPVGTSAGAHPGSKDLYETLKISRDQLRSNRDDIAPSVQAEMALLRQFSFDLDAITTHVLSTFSVSLNREPSLRFENYHDPDQPSRTTLSMFRYPAQSSIDEGVGHNKHTDLGTLTLLLTEQWGLQVLSPSTQQWEFIEPRPGMAVVNVGDSLRFLSGNMLKSSVHRVVPLQELQREDRYSLAYFSRPADNVTYRTATGEVVRARAWHDRKFDTFREPHEVQASDVILTGGMERGERIVVA